MPDKDKVIPLDRGTGLGGDDRKEQNREFSNGDQQFGGGPGEQDYGDPIARPSSTATSVEDAADESVGEYLEEEADEEE